MSEETLGFATAIPATALVTDTAGVKMPSAMVKLVPNKAYSDRSARARCQAVSSTYPDQ